MAPLAIGLIGYGSWTRQAYLPALARDGRAAVVAVAAPSAATQARARAELGPAVAVYGDSAELLRHPELEALMVAVPDAAHEAVLTACLESELPLFYEPPLTTVRARAMAMIARLLAAPQLTHADLELGFTPVIARTRQLVQSGVLGTLRTATIRLQASWGAASHPEANVVSLLVPWYLDVLNRLCGRLPSRALWLGDSEAAGQAQNHATGIFDYDRLWATFQVNLASVGPLTTHVEVNGDDGDLYADIFAGELRWRTRDQPEWAVEERPALQPHAGWPGMHECVTAFLDALLEGRSSDVDARTTAQLYLIGRAVERSQDTGTWAPVASLDSVTSPTA